MNSHNSFPLYLITSPEDFADEHVLLEALFARGLRCLHVRKPRKDSRALERWILELDPSLRPQLVVHGHADLVHAFGLAGWHGVGGTSASFHSFADIADCTQEYSYGFLSPILDSLSKPGYRSAFSRADLAAGFAMLRANGACKVANVIALGGIDAGQLSFIHSCGFQGAAVLGAVWNAADPIAAWDELLRVSYEVMGNSAPHYGPIESWRDALVLRRGGRWS